MNKQEKTENNHYLTDTFIVETREKMLAFAQSQLKDGHRADDAVQEALTAALQYQGEFRGQALFKTWVFAILKNKIADQIRKNSRYTPVSQLQTEQSDSHYSDEELLCRLFKEGGHWHKDSRPQAFDDSWQTPEDRAQTADFWPVLEACLAHLPAAQSKAFLMREYLELETEVICAEMQITTKNFYTLMHRARLRLQQCLNTHWFV